MRMEVKYGVFKYLEVRGEGTVVENPVKSRALTPISLRGVILLRDGNSLLDCNERGQHKECELSGNR